IQQKHLLNRPKNLEVGRAPMFCPTCASRNCVPTQAQSVTSYLVDKTRQIRNLTLVGFMGTGKSSVGRLAADILHFTFLDTDDVVVARAGLTVNEIFQQQGEAAFRELERRIVQELTRRNKTLISAGGGLPADPDNLASLKS